MDWQGEGYILSVKAHGETSVILNVITKDKGRHAGLVRGGRSRRMRPVLQAGNKVSLRWHARLSEHLGSFNVEPLDARAAIIMENRLSLSALNALTATTIAALPEREPYPKLYMGLEILLKNLHNVDIWPALFIRYEIALLEALGYGLNFSKCAATGSTKDLTYISPRSGRAVSTEAAAPYVDKLLALPNFLMGENALHQDDIANGFALCSYFLRSRVFHPINKDIPQARTRLIEELKTVGLL